MILRLKQVGLLKDLKTTNQNITVKLAIFLYQDPTYVLDETTMKSTIKTTKIRKITDVPDNHNNVKTIMLYADE